MHARSILRSLTAALLVQAGAVSAQQAGKLRLLVDPGSGFSFVVDHKFRMQQREVELSTGAHHFTFWAPQRSMVDTSFIVEPDRTKDVIVRLPFSAEYRAYERAMDEHRAYMRANRLWPMAITLGSLVYTGVKLGPYRKAYDALQQDKSDYEHAVIPQTITSIKRDRLPQHKEEFEKAQRGFRIAAGISILAAGTTAYLYARSAKRRAPVFIDQEKVRFDGLAWVPGPQGGQWMTGLTIDLARR